MIEEPVILELREFILTSTVSFTIHSKINSEWVYSVRAAYQDFLQEFADVLVTYHHFCNRYSPFCATV